jgi:hypothetical protein
MCFRSLGVRRYEFQIPSFANSSRSGQWRRLFSSSMFLYGTVANLMLIDLTGAPPAGSFSFVPTSKDSKHFSAGRGGQYAGQYTQTLFFECDIQQQLPTIGQLVGTKVYFL